MFENKIYILDFLLKFPWLEKVDLICFLCKGSGVKLLTKHVNRGERFLSQWRWTKVHFSPAPCLLCKCQRCHFRSFDFYLITISDQTITRQYAYEARMRDHFLGSRANLIFTRRSSRKRWRCVPWSSSSTLQSNLFSQYTKKKMMYTGGPAKSQLK